MTHDTSRSDWFQFSDLFSEVSRNAVAAANLILARNGRLHAERFLEDVTLDDDLISLFGASPGAVKLKITSKSEYDKWFCDLWGRRASYFLSVFVNGLKDTQGYLKGFNHGAGEIDVGKLDILRKTLSIRFDDASINIRGWTPEASLSERHDIAPFHCTYLDPSLFSSLMLLAKSDRNSITLSKAGRQKLLELIATEIRLYTRNGQEKITSIADEATIWWGMSKLIAAGKNGHKVEGLNINESDYMLNICSMLISTNSIQYPDPKMAMKEATPEIHGEIRTRIFIAKNCISIINDLRDKNIKIALKILWPHCIKQLLWLSSETKITSHIYYLGVMLELYGSLFRFLELGLTVADLNTELVETLFEDHESSISAEITGKSITDRLAASYCIFDKILSVAGKHAGDINKISDAAEKFYEFLSNTPSAGSS